ncbi:LysR family transcriptional regulator [Microbispora sp. CA-102843]|uniref:LysR family transcriptional regulator n=1 Tax=Microbispora sp. CA-102843 TaxID=3239952 RepID=UPI003D8C33C8
MVELRVLRYFLAVVDSGSMTAAAAEVRVAQPSVSRQLRMLERELGVELLHRTRTGVHLTAAGRRFLPVARDLVLRAARGAELLQAHGTGSPLNLRVVCPASTITHLVAPYLAESSAPFADAYVAEPDEVYARLEAGAADIAIGTNPPPAGLAALRLGRRRITAQAPAAHPLGRETGETGDLELRELAAHPLILSGRRSAVRRAVDAALHEHALHIRLAAETRSEAMAQALAAAGRGVCVVLDNPQFGLRARTVTAGGALLTITLYAAWDADHYARDEIAAVMGDMSTWLELLTPGGGTAESQDAPRPPG